MALPSKQAGDPPETIIAQVSAVEKENHVWLPPNFRLICLCTRMAEAITNAKKQLWHTLHSHHNILKELKPFTSSGCQCGLHVHRQTSATDLS